MADSLIIIADILNDYKNKHIKYFAIPYLFERPGHWLTIIFEIEQNNVNIYVYNPLSIKFHQ